MAFVKKAFGVVMWLGAIFYAAPHLSTTVTALLTAAVMLGTGVFGWPDPEDGEGWVTVRVRQLWAIVGGIVGAYLLLGVLVREGFILPPVSLAVPSAGGAAAQAEGIEWMNDEAAALARAQAENKPLVIDFTAEWCQACHELDRYTFSDAQVAGLARGEFIALRLDCTKGGDPAVRAVQQKYGVTGLPTVVFTRPDGTPVDKTIGFVEAAPFLAVMQKALATVRG
jgi:thiol:disulfide interchange protein DsbD